MFFWRKTDETIWKTPVSKRQGSNYGFALRKVNSSYCNCKVVNHTKMWSSFSPKEIYFIHITFSHIISKLYPHFTVCCIAFFIRNIVHIQNCITKCTKCFSILIKCFACGRLKSLLRSAYLLGSNCKMIIQMLRGPPPFN